MKLKCIIIDDEITARNILKKYITNVPFLVLLKEFRNAIEALDYLNSTSVEVVFLDIEMPRFSGLKLARILDSNTRIIFTTAHREFALDGFELNAVDYLLKPVSFERFMKAVHKAHRSIGTAGSDKEASDHFFVKVDKKMVRIEYSDIRYLEAMGNYVKICTSNEIITVYDSIKNISKKLSSVDFLRVHKSFVVNMRRIQSYTREFVEIDKKHIPIGRSYRDETLAALSKE